MVINNDNLELNALFDIGSSISIIHERLCSKHNLTIYNENENKNTKIIAANGETVKISGKVRFNLEFSSIPHIILPRMFS